MIRATVIKTRPNTSYDWTWNNGEVPIPADESLIVHSESTQSEDGLTLTLIEEYATYADLMAYNFPSKEARDQGIRVKAHNISLGFTFNPTIIDTETNQDLTAQVDADAAALWP